MKIGQILSQKQQQSLKMTPRLQQAISLLTINHQDLVQVLEKELAENPLLEITESVTSKKSEDEEFDWEKYVSNYNERGEYIPINRREETSNFENLMKKEDSLDEHLMWQLQMLKIADDEREFATKIIYNLKEDGFLVLDFDELIVDSGISRDKGLKVLKMVQNFDPVGCGSRNLPECLLVQMKALGKESKLLEQVICEHIDELQYMDHSKLATKLGVDLEILDKELLFLKKLNPRPGNLVGNNGIRYIVPDIFIVKEGTKFKVKLNSEGIPRLHISKLYQEMIKNKEAASYIKEKLNNARFLLKALKARKSSLRRVAEAVLERQHAFFNYGPSRLTPMILKDVASQLGIHESTVSRVVTGKYLSCHMGVFELKYFFSSSVKSMSGEGVASEVLKLKIKEVIGLENKQKPLSDAKIVEKLRDQSIIVARRTVTKYREALNIGDYRKRKEVAKPKRS